MSVGALSARVTLEQSRKQAKDLLKAFKAGNSQALDRIRWNHPRCRGLSDASIQKRKFALADAQLVIARLHYFESWPKLVQHIEALQAHDPRVMRFESAADAIIAGDIPALRALLDAHPELVHQRSTRAHRAPLLHFIAANGVEDYRQLSPPNAVDVARLLLDAGAEVDAATDVYGGGSTALNLVATSTPPRIAGVQIPLIDLLLERGAAIDGVKPGASTAEAALANNCPEAAVALVARGARVPNVITAAGVGHLELVRRHADVASQEQLERALIMAARYGRHAVVEYLLDRGVEVGASDGMTALHWAAGGAHLETMQLLIERGAPLEAKNEFGGTVLDSTLWFASHVQDIDYAPAVDMLITAGASTDIYPEMREVIERVSRRAH
jgi:ankyrin repeat protein